MLHLAFAPADLAGLRFVHSPMVEVVTSALAGRPAFSAVLGCPSGCVPDFLTPVLPVARPTLEDELREIAATPLDRVSAEVAASWTNHLVPEEIARFGTDPEGALAELIRQIRGYFSAVIAPLWPALRTVVEGEIAHRSRMAAERGPRAMLQGLHPSLDWDGAELLLASPKTRHWELDGHALALMPAGFAGSKVHPLTESPTGRALWYPPRGHGRVAEAAPADPSAALAALLGPTRADVLTLLAAPHSTGEVASALGLAPATASHHLTTLRDAGLIAGDRVGRRLHYLRTGLGEQLWRGVCGA